MAQESANLLTVKAARISDAAQRIKDATDKVELARAALWERTAELSRATAEQKPDAEKVAAQAKSEFIHAQERLQFERDQLAALVPAHEAAQPPSQAATLTQYLVFGFLALVVLMFLMYGIVSQTLLPSLSSIAASRGLITFLIAVITVTIALILLLATVVSDSADRARRFSQGREVLTALIGVLGTIVGFYFGHANETSQNISFAPPYLSSKTLTAGEKFSIVTFISGGKAPYVYDVTFSPPIIAAIKGAGSRDGSVNLLDLISDSVTQDTRVDFEIRVRDSEGRPGQYTSTSDDRHIDVKPKPKE